MSPPGRHTLLLRLAGPMQAWDDQSRFTVRSTRREPTKSGVVGLLGAALGLSRDTVLDTPPHDFAALKMTVRVDREGRLERDYQTAADVVRADGSGTQDTVVSERYYLADACFTVAFEARDDQLMLLRQAAQALANPRWQLFLGRKAFLPAEPILFKEGLYTGRGAEDVLRAVPLARPRDDNSAVRVVREVPFGTPGAEVRFDQPRGASFATRVFGPRHVLTELWPPDNFLSEEVNR